MPLAVQALLPFIVLVGAATALRLPGLRSRAGPVAVVATLAAAGIVATLLDRLAPAERVDLPYLETFPQAPLAIRVDALSAVFGLALLLTASLLMLARLKNSDDRRQPWSGWLLTAAAVLGVLFAANLVLVYVFLQLVTLAWSGALEEAAPRRRALRLSEQIGDLALLAVAGYAIASVGTSAMNGLPSDTLSPAIFVCILLPVAVRLVELALPTQRPRTPVHFEPAVARAVIAGYLVLRMIALSGGRPPSNADQVLMFGAGLVLAAAAAALAWRSRSTDAAFLHLVAAQAGIALACSASGTPLGAIAGVWAWLGVIALGGLACIRQADASLATTLTGAALSVLPPGLLFLPVWLETATLNAMDLTLAAIPLWLAVVAVGLAALRHLQWPARVGVSLPTAWATVLLIGSAAPSVVLGTFVIPAARIVRLIPADTLTVTLTGLRVGTSTVPQLLIVAVASAALVVWLRVGVGFRPVPSGEHLALPAWRFSGLELTSWRRVPWVPIAWLAFGVAVVIAIVQP